MTFLIKLIKAIELTLTVLINQYFMPALSFQHFQTDATCAPKENEPSTQIKLQYCSDKMLIEIT